jgi:ribosomal 50S subunit-recycling heat shock protein
VIEIGFGTRSVKVEVLDVQDTTKKDEAKDLFKYL